MTAYSGTRRLLGLAWRRDRVMLAICVLVIWMLSYYSAAAMATLYPSPTDRMVANEEANLSTGVVAMYGHIYDTASPGGIAANKTGMINYLILIFLVIALVRRHTRAEEESGRFELLGAAPVGRLAPLAAATGLAAVTSVITGVVTIACVIAGGWPIAGSIAFGLALTGVGLAFTAVTAVAMQVSSNTRTCSTWAYATVGAAFVLRMLGDVSHDRGLGWLSWLSPIGWGQQVRAYDGDRLWVLVVPVVFAVVTLAVARALQGRRDLGAGLLPDRPGPASTPMGSPFALAWRLQRGTAVGWVVTYLLLGLLMGSMISTVGGLMSGPAEEMLRKMGGVGQFNDLYMTLVGSMAALGAAAYGISAVLRLRSEESSGHLEQVLATPVRRVTFLLSHLVIAVLGTVVLMVVLGGAMALTHSRSADATGFWREFSPGLVALPATWVMIALALLAVGWLPKLDWLGWALLGAVVVLGELGGLMGLPSWLLEVSPFAHVPKLPVQPMAWSPVVIMALVAVALMGAAVLGYRRRGMPLA